MNCTGASCPSLSGDVSDLSSLSKELRFQSTSNKVTAARGVGFPSVILPQATIRRRNSIAVLLLFLMVTSSTVVPVDPRQDRRTLSPIGFAKESFGRNHSQRWFMRKRRAPPSLKISKPVESSLLHDPPRKGSLQTSVDISNVSVVEGEEAALPCDLRSADPDDTVQIILWIKEGLHTPLYSYDFRELMRGKPKETKPDANSTVSRRTSFRTDRSPAALIIQRAEMEDAGIYRCRVDFRHSPTLNYRVNLTVVVAPTTVRIGWYSNHSSISTANEKAGPFLERSQPTIICANDDGWPPPSVMWYENDQLLDDTFFVDYNQGVVENEMVFPPLTRDDLGRNLTCVASNTDKATPAARSVFIDMTLRIIGVKLMKLGTIWAEEKARAVCQIWGSRPQPNVLWWLGSQMLSPAETKISPQDRNVTLSYLDFVPTSKDDEAMLICQATNELLPDQAVQDSTILSINYAPVVSVHLGHSLDPEKIKEGDDVYFECTVQSKPPVHNVIWKHNGIKLMARPGIILSNMSLVVQGVTRYHGGNYTCHAANVRKTSASAPLHLDVKYTPFCASVQRQQHSVGKLENAEISCKVDANPKNVSFRWTFNNTAEAIDVPEGRFVVVGTESRVNYTPMNELDYGTLLCWANNSIGIQQYPCVFQIVAAGKPDPPHNCKVFDVTISSFQVQCLPGDDGGLNQMFILHLYKVGAVSPIAEFSQATPSFTINNLQPATSYRIVLASVNEKGTSRLIELNAYTIKVLEKLEETSAEPARDRVRGKGVPLEVILGIIGAVVLVVLASVVLVWFRVCRHAARNEEESEGGSAGSGSEASSKCQVKETATTETAVSETTPQVTRHHDIQQPADPSWSTEGALISTISAPPYVVAGGDNQYPAATGAPAPSSEVSGAQYSHYPEQGTYYTYSQCSAEVQLQTPARKLQNVPYYTDSAQLQQVQEPSAIGPSTLEYNPCVLQFPPPPLGQLEQGENYHVATQRGELCPAESQISAAGQDHGKVFPALLHILPGSVSKASQSSHCSVHHCPNELLSVLESSNVPSVTHAINRKGSLKVLSRYRDVPPEPLPVSVPSFQSMEDISKTQRKYPVPVDQFTTSLNRTKHLKPQLSKEAVDVKSCQHLTNTIPRSQRKNKMESAV
ncbi:synaptogenesis protein syg-2-like isoform X2 [Macrobrachium nipponense]|uniref:synaptogenesis protein syg-2-like isoform X2 n=1 Tax=Macrobrachium nipponense TaxID=159736 RepID=UPI0030C7FE91